MITSLATPPEPATSRDRVAMEFVASTDTMIVPSERLPPESETVRPASLGWKQPATTQVRVATVALVPGGTVLPIVAACALRFAVTVRTAKILIEIDGAEASLSALRERIANVPLGSTEAIVVFAPKNP